jgi:hypothetical protein
LVIHRELILPAYSNKISRHIDQIFNEYLPLGGSAQAPDSIFSTDNSAETRLDTLRDARALMFRQGIDVPPEALKKKKKKKKKKKLYHFSHIRLF